MLEPGFAVIDLETTGLHPARDRIVELAVVRLDAVGRPIAELSTVIDPERAMGATEIHGIDSRLVRDAPKLSEVFGAFLPFLRGAVLVAHNLRFDARFLMAELRRFTRPPTSLVGLCTMDLAEDWLEGAHGRSLAACCAAAGIPQSGAHRALDDARATASLFRVLAQRAVHGGIRFDEPLRAAPGVEWPDCAVVRGPVPREASLAARAVVRSPVAKLVERLPAGASGSVEVEAYLLKLDEILEDRVVTDDEGATLETLARELGIASGDLPRIHFRYLRDLAALAVADGEVNDEERTDLEEVAGLLGFPAGAAGAALDAARRTFVGDPSSMRRPIEPGSLVCFSDTDRPKEELEGFARAAGLQVRTTVSKKTTLVVTAHPYSKSAKLEKARALGTRIVVESLFVAMLRAKQLPRGSRSDATTDSPPTSSAESGATDGRSHDGVAGAAWPAGWYPDPSGVPAFRYWDGRVWTAHVAHRSVRR